MLEYSMNDYVRKNELRDYAGYEPPGKIDLDCSLGVNGKDLPELIFEKLHAFNLNNKDDIKHYPHDESLLHRLADYYNAKGAAWLRKENFVLGDGSYDILCNINMMCLTRDQAVLGHAPQFPAYVDHVTFSGSKYDCYQLPKDTNYKFEAHGYIEKMNRLSQRLFIVENPNNPTGQVIPIDELRRIADKSMEFHRILIVDEAYGDYLPFQNSSINLIPNHPNVIVTRTFSKGFGMAGMRLGYAVASLESDLLTQLKKLERPFNCNGIARILAHAMLNSGVDMIDSSRVRTNKNAIIRYISECCPKFGVATTDLNTPIMTVYYKMGAPPPGFDLRGVMAERAKLLTVSCSTYMGLDGGAVRIMLPLKNEDIERLKGMLKTVNDYLP
ncbi:MAG: pyridoxal phosphate-dependent aminotransferase [Treponema sp.]|jgi:histidinol-phosphate aminotransferase|nr:pyridoxal phosphate-dependent aminotransferase [Treponema sp.]